MKGPRAKGPTFQRVYDDATEMRRKAWATTTTEASWRRGFEKYVLPAIGPKPVASVTLASRNTGRTIRPGI